MTDVTNRDRAEWARKACKAFAKETGQKFQADAEDVISDLIGNLMHVCREQEIDFDNKLLRARSAYEEEMLEGLNDDLKEAHDSLSEALENPDCGNDEVRDAAIGMCAAMNAFWGRQ